MGGAPWPHVAIAALGACIYAAVGMLAKQDSLSSLGWWALVLVPASMAVGVWIMPRTDGTMPPPLHRHALTEALWGMSLATTVVGGLVTFVYGLVMLDLEPWMGYIAVAGLTMAVGGGGLLWRFQAPLRNW